jgi:hypothetical protein
MEDIIFQQLWIRIEDIAFTAVNLEDITHFYITQQCSYPRILVPQFWIRWEGITSTIVDLYERHYFTSCGFV